MTTSRDILPYTVFHTTAAPVGWTLLNPLTAVIQDSGGPGVDDIIDPALSEVDDNISFVFSALSPNGVNAECKFGTFGGRCDEFLPIDQFPDSVLYIADQVTATLVAVSEPSVLFLISIGMLGFVGVMKRKKEILS